MRARATRRAAALSGVSIPPPVYVGDFTTGALPPGVTFSRASSGSRVNSAGGREVVGVDIPRFDYDPVSLLCKGLLIENTGLVNGIRYTEDLTNNAYAKVGIEATVNSLTRSSPTATAYTTIGVGNPCPVGASCSVSMRVKQKTTGSRFGLRIQGSYPNRADALFDISTGTLLGTAGSTYTILGATITPDGDGWFRVTLSALAAGTPAGAVVFGPAHMAAAAAIGSWESGVPTVPLATDCFCDQRQFELTLMPSSYLPATTANVSRAVDQCILPTSSIVPNPETSTVVLEFQTPAVLSQVGGLFKMRSSTVSALAAGFYIDHSSKRPFVKVSDAIPDNLETSISGQVVAPDSIGRIALCLSNNSVCAAIRGSIVTRAPKDPGWTGGAFSEMILGYFDNAIGGCVRKVSIWDVAVSPQQLSAMTRM